MKELFLKSLAENKKLEQINTELLEALKQILKEYAPEGLPDQREEVTRAYQAIAKAEEVIK